jgi:hypothetical protein
MTLKEYIQKTNYHKFKIARNGANGYMEDILEFDERKMSYKYITEDILNQKIECALFEMNEENENILENIILLIEE